MTLISDVRGFRGEDAPAAQTIKGKVDRVATTAETSRWQKEHQAQLDALVAHMGYRVSFSVDQQTKRVVVRVLNADTNEVVRQIPAEEVLALEARLDDMVGLLLDRTL
jgi:uncharacterized FlaG/YvyC family protein